VNISNTPPSPTPKKYRSSHAAAIYAQRLNQGQQTQGIRDGTTKWIRMDLKVCDLSHGITITGRNRTCEGVVREKEPS
jgi:hypothetical protein